MKKIYFMLLALLAMSFTFTACSDDDPFSTATADDEPRILDPTFPDRQNGNLPVVANISRNANFTMKLTVTPADHTNVAWFIDGKEVHQGKEIDINIKAGTYNLKVTASTATGKSTYREAIVQVNPLADDPWATEVSFERIIAPGHQARFYGNNLQKVKSIVIDGKTITDFTYIEADGENYIEYTVLADVSEGTHRVILVDDGGNEYGANTVMATKASLIHTGSTRTNANREWVMSGINLSQIASFTMGGQTISEFTRQSATEIAIICPGLEDGEYKLTGKTQTGQDVQFYTNQGIITEQTTTVSSTITLWEGHHYVSWELPDGDPNKTFNFIGKDVFANLTAGAELSIHYSIAPEAGYHKMQTTSGWWGNLPGTSDIEFSEDGVLVVELTQAVLDKIQAEDGFLCVGHGYYVDLVTVK